MPNESTEQSLETDQSIQEVQYQETSEVVSDHTKNENNSMTTAGIVSWTAQGINSFVPMFAETGMKKSHSANSFEKIKVEFFVHNVF